MPLTRRACLLSAAGGAVAWAAGCGGAPRPTEATSVPDPRDPRPLRVAVVEGSEPWLAKLQRSWAAQSEIALELTSLTRAECQQAAPLRADVVLFPAPLLGELADRDWLAPLPKAWLEGDELRAADLLRHARTTSVQWGATTLGVALSAPAPMLYYRRDIFERLQLSPPVTWEAYEQAAARLADREPFADLLDSPADDWAPADERAVDPAVRLLARAAAYARNRHEYGALFDLQTMHCRLATPPWERALAEGVAAARWSAALPDARTASAWGLSWGWPAPQGEWDERLAIAELPGSRDYYDYRAAKWLARERDEALSAPLWGAAGTLAGVTNVARRPKVAERFLAWLSAGEDAPDLAQNLPEPFPARESHLATPVKWLPPSASSQAAAEFVDVIHRIQQRSVLLTFPHLPGSDDYLAAIRQGVENALAGTQTPQAALAAAAEQCEAITEKRGRARQRIAYQRSLGLDV